jgi:hypothetical protein
VGKKVERGVDQTEAQTGEGIALRRALAFHYVRVRFQSTAVCIEEGVLHLTGLSLSSRLVVHHRAEDEEEGQVVYRGDIHATDPR